MGRIEPVDLSDKYDRHTNDLEYAQQDVGILADKLDEVINQLNKVTEWAEGIAKHAKKDLAEQANRRQPDA